MDVNFLPFVRMNDRLKSAKNDSDLSYFYDLLIYGEYLTKIITLFLTASINEDKERTRYSQEYGLVRANAIGDFSKTIDEILTGPSASQIHLSVRDNEFKELTYRASGNDWQYEAQQLLEDCLKIFNLETNDLPTKSPLRNWFQKFVYLRNKTRGHGATRIEPCSKASPILENSINTIIKNLTMFNRSWAHIHRNLSGKYRVSYLTEGCTEFNFLKSSTSHVYENGIYCYIDEPKRINLFYSNPELTDFFITNGNLKGTSFESISYTTDDRELQNADNFLSPIGELPSSHTEGAGSLEIIGNCFTNLPKSIDEYIKRPILEKELTDVLLEEDRFPIITLLGKGGVGKTSLALNVVKNILHTSRFDIAVWFSARDIDLLSEGPKNVKAKILNQEDIASDYFQLVDSKGKIAKKSEEFAKLLTKNNLGKALYVFDNFETVTNPNELYEWINTYIRNPNKILITSGISRNFKADYPIEVKGMNDNECKDLICIYSKKLNIDDLIDVNYIEDLITESDGHPYIIKILLGEVAKAKKIGKAPRIVAEQEKILTALFKRTFNTLSPEAKRVFLTLSSWNSIVPLVAVEAILWRPENEKIDVDSAIEELRNSSFIDIINNNDQELINVPLAASLFGKTELEVYPEKLKILDDRQLLMEFGATSYRDTNIDLDNKIYRKFNAVAKRTNTLQAFKRELPTLEYLAGKYPKAYEYIIQIFEEYRDYNLAIHYTREFIKNSNSDDQKAPMWLKLSNTYRLIKDWDGESHALTELAILPNVPFEIVSEAANRINSHFFHHPESKDVEYKQTLLDKVIEVMKRRIYQGNATDYSRLAWLLINNDQEREAHRFVEEGLRIDSENEYCINLYNRTYRY